MDGLADPTRLRLLHVLERHELGVAELCEVLQQPQSTVSRHLKILSSQGWIEVRRRGQNQRARRAARVTPARAARAWRRRMSGENPNPSAGRPPPRR
jgi:ArsR family transcriptional regulator